MGLINVRTATHEDADWIATNNVAMALETEGLALDAERASLGVRAVLDDEAKGFYLVAEKSEKKVGQLLVTYEWSDWRNRLMWWFQSVYIEPEARRSGVFRALFDEVRARASARGGVGGVRLYVEEENRRAQATYEALGMRRSHYLMYELGLDAESAEAVSPREPRSPT